MPLSDQDADRIRYHLGYPATLTASSMSFGVPAPIDTLFLVDIAIGIVKDGWPVDKIRELLNELDNIEKELSRARRRFSVSKLEGLELRSIERGKSEADALEIEYGRWAFRLCDVLRVTTYPFSERFSAFLAVHTGNVRMRG